VTGGRYATGGAAKYHNIRFYHLCVDNGCTGEDFVATDETLQRLISELSESLQK
jgi:hypothetical protein